MNAIIGILALQGDFDQHRKVIAGLGHSAELVRTSDELKRCAGLILPGGESTTMTKLLKKHSLWDDVKTFCLHKPVFGTCAGLILLSTRLENESEHVLTLAALDITVQRNAYGRQIDSFIDKVSVDLHGKPEKLEGIFIRAPIILSCGLDVVARGWHEKQIVMVEKNNVLATTFHPELGADAIIHRYFLDKVISSVHP